MSKEFIYVENEVFRPFPDSQEFSLKRGNEKYLIPIGVFIHDGNKVLIAAPVLNEEGFASYENPQPFECGQYHLSYSKLNGVWGVDADLSFLSATNNDYQEAIKSCELGSIFYKKNGFLQYNTSKEPNEKLKAPIFNFDNFSVAESNWYGSLPPSIKSSTEPGVVDGYKHNIVTLYDNDGNVFEYLGSVYASHYVNPMSGHFLYFYEKNTEKMLVIVEYS